MKRDYSGLILRLRYCGSDTAAWIRRPAPLGTGAQIPRLPAASAQRYTAAGLPYLGRLIWAALSGPPHMGWAISSGTGFSEPPHPSRFTQAASPKPLHPTVH